MRSSTMWRRLVVLAVSVCLESMFGCAGQSEPVRGPTGTVSGKVTLNGKPVPEGCTVLFMHAEKSVPASATTGADGKYSAANVLAGPNKVAVSPPAKTITAADASNPEAYKAMMSKGKGGKAEMMEEKSPIARKYVSPEKSGLTFTVKEGSNTYDIELKE